MTNHESILVVKGIISELPPAQQEACKELVEFIREAVKKAGSPVGQVAVALIGLEMQEQS